MPAKTDRRHRQGLESRQRIIEAALAIATERGYDGTTVALVTERAGVPASSIYWQFKNKDELLAEALDFSYRRWRSEGPTWQPANYTGTPGERIRTRLGYSIASVKQELTYWRLGLTLALLRRPGGIAAQERFTSVRAETRKTIEAWWTEVDPEAGRRNRPLMRTLTGVYLALVDGMFVNHRADPEDDLELLERVVGDALADVYERRAALEPTPRRRLGRRKVRRGPRSEDDTRSRLLDATAEIASEQGYRGTTISRICERAGVPVSSVYWFFTDKDELLAEVVTHSWEEWSTTNPRWAPLADGASWTRALQLILDDSLRSYPESPAFLRIGQMLTLESDVDVAARDRYLSLRTSVTASMGEWFAEAIPPAAVRREPRLPLLLAKALVTMTDGYFLDEQIDGRGPAVADFVDVVVEILDSAVQHYTTGD